MARGKRFSLDACRGPGRPGGDAYDEPDRKDWHVDFDHERRPRLPGHLGARRGLRAHRPLAQRRLPVRCGLQVPGRRRAQGHDQEPPAEPGGRRQAHGRGGRGPRRQRRAGHAVRHLGDGRELDRDLRLRHGRGDRADRVNPAADARTDLVRACFLEPVTRTPVWFMRQAGRSLPEYRAARGDGSILSAIGDAALSAELTLQPVLRYGVDAAIVFSYIVVPLHAIGFGVEVEHGRGPVVAEPFRAKADLARLRPFEPATDAPYVAETVGLVRRELAGSGVALIGFAGAPFTVASYAVEGGPSRTFAKVKALMHGDPELWRQLTDRLAAMAVASLRAQIEAGAQAVQLFDSWAGSLSPDEYTRLALPSTLAVLDGIADLGVPTILFGVGTGELLALMGSAGSDVVGVDWRVPLDEARRRVGSGRALQGNLDPALCLAPWPVVAEASRAVLAAAADGTGTGHVFNLGHGVLPESDPGILGAVVELVHAETARA